MSTVLVQGRSLYGRLKREIAESILSHSSEKNYRRLMAASNKIAKTEHQKAIAAWIDNRLVEGNPGGLSSPGC